MVEDTPLVSVVVPCFQAESTLALCLGALAAQRYPRDRYEVIVVDDGSTDGSRAIARAHPVRLVEGEHRGASAARNRGVAASEGELVVYVDADCVVGPDFVDGHARAYRRTGGKALVGGAIEMYEPGATWVSYCDHYSSKWYMQHPRASTARTLEYLHTTNLGLPRAILDAVGPLDETLPTGEDVEFCSRVREAGIAMVFDPAIVAFHIARPSLGRYLRRHYRWGAHAVPLRARRKNLAYSWMFPRSLPGAVLLYLPIVAGYSALIFKNWFSILGARSFVYLPAIVGSRLAYAAGVFRGVITHMREARNRA